MAAVELVDFLDIQGAVLEQLKIPSSDTTTLARIKRDINNVYLNEVVPAGRWTWLNKRVDIIHRKSFPQDDTITASVTEGSTTVTLSSAIPLADGSKKDHVVNFNGTSTIYTIASHTAGSDTLELTVEYVGETDADAGVAIWKEFIDLPIDCRETIDIRHDFRARPMIPRGVQKIDEIRQSNAQREDLPKYYSTDDFMDPSTGDGETESDRFRISRIYPAKFDKDLVLHVLYVQEATALDVDGDEPVMPIEDRIVLVYGALRQAWMRERNNEMAALNEQKFQEKLAKMLARYEDTSDHPRVEVDDWYINLKREPLKQRFRGD